MGGMEVSEARRLHALEDENRRLKRIVTDRVRQVAVEKPEYRTGDIPKEEIARLIKDFEKQPRTSSPRRRP